MSLRCYIITLKATVHYLKRIHVPQEGQNARQVVQRFRLVFIFDTNGPIQPPGECVQIEIRVVERETLDGLRREPGPVSNF